MFNHPQAHGRESELGTQEDAMHVSAKIFHLLLIEGVKSYAGDEIVDSGDVHDRKHEIVPPS